MKSTKRWPKGPRFWNIFVQTHTKKGTRLTKGQKELRGPRIELGARATCYMASTDFLDMMLGKFMVIWVGAGTYTTKPPTRYCCYCALFLLQLEYINVNREWGWEIQFVWTYVAGRDRLRGYASLEPCKRLSTKLIQSIRKGALWV